MIKWRRLPNNETRQRSEVLLEQIGSALRLVDYEFKQVSSLPALDIVRTPFRNQLTRNHHSQTIALLGFFEIVRSHQDRRAGIG